MLDYGRSEHDHRGSTIVYFNKAARQRLERAHRIRDLERYLDAYAVVAGTGEVITVGHRDKRIPRH